MDTGNSRIERSIITHLASPYLHRTSPYGTNSKKKRLSVFDWSHTNFCCVADLQTRSIDGVNTDVVMPYPCRHFPVRCSPVLTMETQWNKSKNFITMEGVLDHCNGTVSEKIPQIF